MRTSLPKSGRSSRTLPPDLDTVPVAGSQIRSPHVQTHVRKYESSHHNCIARSKCNKLICSQHDRKYDLMGLGAKIYTPCIEVRILSNTQSARCSASTNGISGIWKESRYAREESIIVPRRSSRTSGAVESLEHGKLFCAAYAYCNPVTYPNVAQEQEKELSVSPAITVSFLGHFGRSHGSKTSSFRENLSA